MTTSASVATADVAASVPSAQPVCTDKALQDHASTFEQVEKLQADIAALQKEHQKQVDMLQFNFRQQLAMATSANTLTHLKWVSQSHKCFCWSGPSTHVICHLATSITGCDFANGVEICAQYDKQR